MFGETSRGSREVRLGSSHATGAASQPLDDPDERANPLLQDVIDERDKPRVAALHPDPLPVDRVGQDVAIQAEPIAIMPAGELGGGERVIHVRERLRTGMGEVMDREDDGYPGPPGEVDHALGDGVATIGEPQVGVEGLEVSLEEPQDQEDLVRPWRVVPSRIRADEIDRDLTSAQREGFLVIPTPTLRSGP